MVHLNFSNPMLVSTGFDSDEIIVKIKDNWFLKDEEGNQLEIDGGFEISEKLPI